MAFGTHFDESKVKRDKDGQFAKKAFTGIKGPAWLSSIKGKQPPKSFKFYKQGYTPKAKSSITGANASSDGKQLWEMKKQGLFGSDYEFWLAAGKLASAYKKNHPNNAATPHSIVNMAFHHEMEETGSKPKIGQYGQSPAEKAGTAGLPDPNAGKFAHEPAGKSTYAKTASGLEVKSKYLAPGDLKPTGKKMSGVNGAMVYEDAKGQQWLVKFPGGSKGTSKAYSNSLFLVDLDVATSRIQSKAGLPVPSIHAKTVDGKTASVHKMYSRVKDAFPTNNPVLSGMDDADLREIQKNMVLDWLISNHDPHTGNFLQTDKGIIGIDKGQSFKYFGKDKLTPAFGSDLNPPLAPNKPVYSTLMQQHKQGLGNMFSFENDPEVRKTIDRLMAIPDDDYKKLLRPYAEKARKQGLLNYPGKSYSDTDDEAVEKFLQAATDRKNNLLKDFQGLDKQLSPAPEMGPPSGGKSDAELNQDSPDVKSYKEAWDAGNYEDVNDFMYDVQEDVISKTLTKAEADALGEYASKSPAKPKLTPKKVSKYTAKDFAEGDYFTYKGEAWKVTKAGNTALKAENQVHFGAKIFNSDEIGQIESKASAKGNAWEQANEVLQSHPKMAKGYAIKPHPDDPDKVGIVKPTGDWSKSKDGVVKSWNTGLDALESSTMAKYKQQADYSFNAQLSGAQMEAKNAPDNDPSTQLQGAEAIEYTELKDKVSKGEHTPDDYLKFKTLKSKLLNSKKAQGAAQIEDDFEVGGFAAPPAPAKPAAKQGFKEMPKFKLKGGAPPALSTAKGPNAISLGQQLYAMKKAGLIENDHKMWSEAKKLAGQDKKAALKLNADAKIGDDYTSANQIRNVAMRLEFDETGDVVWATTEQMTSGEVGQTVAQIKKTIALHDHVPSQENPDHFPNPNTQLGVWTDKTKPAGSYDNPHAFMSSAQAALRKWGYKYTKHASWDASQKNAWYTFTGSGSSSINNYFRTGEAGMYGGSTKQYCNGMLDAFRSDNVKPLDDWTIVTRGTSGGWEFGIGADTVSFDDIKAMEGKVVRNKCPVSSSLAVDPAFSSKPVKITYKLPPGFRGLFVGGKSACPGENEMILPPGMAYRILEVKQNNSGYGGKTEVLVEVVDVKLPENFT